MSRSVQLFDHRDRIALARFDRVVAGGPRPARQGFLAMLVSVNPPRGVSVAPVALVCMRDDGSRPVLVDPAAAEAIADALTRVNAASGEWIRVRVVRE